MKIYMLFLLCFGRLSFAAPSDFENLPFLSQNIKLGLGMSYTKLEATSAVGNYFLLSEANPRFEMSYSTPIVDLYRQRFFGSYLQEVFRPENDSLALKTGETQGSLFLSWQPIWLNEEKSHNRYLRFAVKNSSVVSELPDTVIIIGDIANRYSLEAGFGFSWYGLTVSKFPLNLDAEILYSQTLFDHAKMSIYNGFIYRFGLDFEFKKRSLFAGWGFRGFYQYEDIKNDYSHHVNKELGIMLNRSISF